MNFNFKSLINLVSILFVFGSAFAGVPILQEGAEDDVSNKNNLNSEEEKLLIQQAIASGIAPEVVLEKANSDIQDSNVPNFEQGVEENSSKDELNSEQEELLIQQAIASGISPEVFIKESNSEVQDSNVPSFEQGVEENSSKNELSSEQEELLIQQAIASGISPEVALERATKNNQLDLDVVVEDQIDDSKKEDILEEKDDGIEKSNGNYFYLIFGAILVLVLIVIGFLFFK